MKKWLPVKSVHMNLLPAKTLGRKQNHAERISRKPVFAVEQSHGQKSGKEAKTGRLTSLQPC